MTTNPHDTLKVVRELRDLIDLTTHQYQVVNEAAALLESLSQHKAEHSFECGARKSSSPEPSDCNWPMCGCDEYASKVISALDECGALKDQHKAEQEPETEAWLIEWDDTHGHRKKVYQHNAVADYRALYEDVTVTELVRRGSQQPAQEPIKLNIARLSASLESETIQAPSGMSIEEKRQFILSHAQQPAQEMSNEEIRRLVYACTKAGDLPTDDRLHAFAKRFANALLSRAQQAKGE